MWCLTEQWSGVKSRRKNKGNLWFLFHILLTGPEMRDLPIGSPGILNRKNSFLLLISTVYLSLAQGEELGCQELPPALPSPKQSRALRSLKQAAEAPKHIQKRSIYDCQFQYKNLATLEPWHDDRNLLPIIALGHCDITIHFRFSAVLSKVSGHQRHHSSKCGI